MLIADDNSALCSSLAATFEQLPDFELAGFVDNGADALYQICSTLPDVLVLDIVMPTCDGLTLLRKLQQLKLSKSPIIFVISCFTNSHTQQETIKLGVHHYLPKPFETDTLVNAIRAVCTSRPSRVSTLLLELGVPVQVRGYDYLRSAIILSMEEPHVLQTITTILYPRLAEQFVTTPSRVERALRHAIKVTWDRLDEPTFDRFFSLPDRGLIYRKRPSNRDFIGALSAIMQGA